MASNQTADRNSSGPVRRLFLDHPRSLGMSWAGHGIGAVKIGAELVGAGLGLVLLTLLRVLERYLPTAKTDHEDPD